jgi:signal transduction histidine kinase/CheY-like chemotaxis protein
MRFKFKSITGRVFALFVPTIVLTFVFFTAVDYRTAVTEINTVFDGRMHASLRAAELKMQLELHKNRAVAVNLANYAKSLDRKTFDHAQNKKKLAEYIGVNENTVGGGIWFEPYLFDSASYRFGTYLYYDTDDEYYYHSHYGDIVDFYSEDWYRKGKRSKGETAWSSVYYDPVSALDMVTVAKPFFDGKGRFAGMGTADMDIASVRRIVKESTVGRTGHTFIIGPDGEYVTSSLDEGQSARFRSPDGRSEALSSFVAEMLANDSGTTMFVNDGRRYRVYYMTVSEMRWTMAVAVDDKEIRASVLKAFTVTMIIPAAGLLAIIMGIFLFVRYLRRIVGKVNAFADMAASGDFSKRVDVTETDEFGFMERRLNKMIESMDAMSRESAELLRAAEEANRGKSDFLSRMSHEIRSPMNAIIGMTQIAKASDDPERISDCLAKIDNASKHLLALINDVLDMSKIEANKFELSSDEFSLRKALEKIYDMMNVKAEEKKQTMTLNVNKNTPERVAGDELRLSQVITNLVSNAIKFTDAGGKIEIDVREVEKSGAARTIRVDVRDTGIGLTQQQRRRLFKPFEQADGNITRKFGGTGLGLAINKRIVEMMGGHIWVESEMGGGSVFSFTAKVGEASGSADIGAAERCAPKTPRVVQAKDMRILVADDSEEAGEYMAHTLSTLGFECEFARDGKEAVELAEKAMAERRPYDIIFMDYVMPGMNGIDAAKKIREITHENISIVMVSIYDWKDFEAKARGAGITKCVPKPVSPSAVLDSISESVACVIKNEDAVITAPHAAGFGGNTILLVEDIEINREIVVAYLEDTGVRIDFAVNGAEAVEKFRQNPEKYDIILMDIQMPEMDGFEATRRIRAMDTKKAKSVPIVAMTANAMTEDVRKCKEAGMNDHMAKPIDPETLLLKLNDFFFMKRYLGRDIW